MLEVRGAEAARDLEWEQYALLSTKSVAQYESTDCFLVKWTSYLLAAALLLQ